MFVPAGESLLKKAIIWPGRWQRNYKLAAVVQQPLYLKASAEHVNKQMFYFNPQTGLNATSHVKINVQMGELRLWYCHHMWRWWPEKKNKNTVEQ